MQHSRTRKTLLAGLFGLALTIPLAAPGSARADSFNVTIGKAGAQSADTQALCANLGSGSCTIGVESFSGRTSMQGFSTDFGTGGTITGTYSPVQINDADIYGGAGGTGQYAVAFSGDPYSVTLATSLSTGINYFGYWLSALDSGNLVTFLKNGAPVYRFTPSDLITYLGSCNTGGNAYCGNPNSNVSGTNNQLYAFVNFFDTDGTFDTIQFTENPNAGGYESDNHTVGYVTAETGTAVPPAIVPEPASLALLGAGLLGLAATRRRS